MATYDCSFGGIRARAAKYWYGDPPGNLGYSVDNSDSWDTANNGKDFWGGNLNPVISDPSGNNKYTVCIKVTTPNLSNVTIDALTISFNFFNRSQNDPSTYPLYASLRTTSVSDSSDTYSTFRNYAIGSEASCTWVWGDERNPETWMPTFYGNFQPNTSYYLFLYTKSTSQIYGMYMDATMVNTTWITYTQNAATYSVSLSRGTGISSVSINGVNTSSSTFTEGSSVTISATPSSGYTFSNWTGSGTVSANPYTFTIYSNVSYTANASVGTYVVQFLKGNHGSGTNSSLNKTYNQNLTLPQALFTRTGYTQTDWASDLDGKVWANSLGGTYQQNSSATFYPYWTPNVYTLTINPNGGTMYNGATTTTNSFTTEFAYNTRTYIGNLDSYDGYWPENLPTKVGYVCTGFTFSAGSGEQNTSGNDFYFMGESPETTVMATGNDTRTWVFNGNYAGNVTATAQFAGVNYQVQYNANGGTGSMSNTSHVYGTASQLRANTFTRSGYTFTGWNTKADGTGTTYANNGNITTGSTTQNGLVQLYAQWGEATYEIIFNLKGGVAQSGDFSNMVCARNTSYNLPTGTITLDNYIFSGWDTSPSASTVVHAPGAAVNNIANAGATVTLYAVWTAKTFKIKYNDNSNGNILSVDYIPAVTTNTFRNLPSGWTKDGYEAIGWSKSATATAPDYRFGQGFIGDLGTANGATLNLYVVWVQQQPWSISQVKIYINSRKDFATF